MAVGISRGSWAASQYWALDWHLPSQFSRSSPHGYGMEAAAPNIIFSHKTSGESGKRGGIKKEAHSPCISRFIPRSPQRPHPLNKSHWPEELSHVPTPCSSLAKVTTSSMVAIEISWFSSWGQAYYLLNKISVLVAKKKRKRKKKNGYSEVANRIYCEKLLYSRTSESFSIWMCSAILERERELMYGVTNLSGHGTPVTKHLMRLGFCGRNFGKHCPTYAPSIFLLNLHNITFRLNRNLCSLE